MPKGTHLRAAVITAVGVTFIVAGCSSGGGAGADPTASSKVERISATPTNSAKPTAKATRGQAALGATGSPSVAVSLAPAVEVGDMAYISRGVRIYVATLRDITVKARQPGEVAGPAVAVPVTVRNNSDKPFSLGGMVVTVSYHGGTPGNQTTSGPSKTLVGLLAVGKSARGMYVFNVPVRYASSVEVQVSSDESPTIVQFRR